MAERDATGGRTPGPGRGGGGNNTSAAAASRIRVDISDVSKLKTSLSQTQVEAKKLGETLAKFDDRSVKAVRAAREEVEKLQRALGAGGLRGASGPKSNVSGTSSGVGGANQHAGSFSGGQTTLGGAHSSYTPAPMAVGGATGFGGSPAVNLLPTGSQGPSMMSRAGSYLTTPIMSAGRMANATPMQMARATPAAAMGAAVWDMGAKGVNLLAGHYGASVDRSYLANQFQLATGGSMSGGAQRATNAQFSSMLGRTGLGYADTSAAMGTLSQTGAVGGAAGAARMGSVGFLSTINPNQGNAASAAQVAGTFTSQNYYAMRIAGVQMNPNNQNIGQLFDQIISRYESQVGRSLTPQEIQSAAQQGSPLNVTVTAMGISADLMPQLIRYWMQRSRTGQRGTAASNAASGRGNLYNRNQQMTEARGRAQEQVDKGAWRGYSTGAQARTGLYNAAGAAAGTDVGQAITEAGGALAMFTGVVGTATKALQALVTWTVAQRLIGGGGGGGRGIPGVVRAAATRAGASTAAARVATSGAGLAGTTVAAAAVPVAMAGAFVAGSNAYNDHFRITVDKAMHPKGVQVGVARLAKQRVSQMYPRVPQGSPLWWSLVAQTMDHFSMRSGFSDFKPDMTVPQTGGSDQAANIWGGSGQTFKTLETMAAKGPHEIVTSTTGGKHATNSYHYKGQAIDLADKAGSVDSPGLLAINKYLAKNYGHKLAELIYAGPGGVNIKNGKVVNGLGTYGSATMSAHHNHVHVAATPASLGMSGGVDVGGAGGPSSASSSGGFSSPASSGAGMGDLFRTSSGDALLAALAGGSGAAGGSAGHSGVPGGGHGAAGGSGGPPGAMPKGNLAQWERQGLALVGLSYNKYAAGLTKLINHESGGNPKAINLWDSNAKAGHPSKGLMQEIDSTFNAYALPGHKNIWNPVDNIAAGVKYIEHTYGLGMLQAGGRRDSHGNYIGYARGTAEILRDEMAQLHKGEMVFAAPEAKMIRQMASKANAGGGASSGGGRGAVVPVQLVFQVMQGGESEARAHAARFARFVAEDHDIEMTAAR